MTKKQIDNEELQKVSGGLFPDGEFPHGVLVCPRCGAGKDRLELQEEMVMEFPESQIHALVKDHIYRIYLCKDCGYRFWHYGDFYEAFKD